MKEMDQFTFEAFAKIMLEKYGWQRHAYPDPDEFLLSVIQGVIADTSLLMEDKVTLVDWQKAMAEA